MEMGIDVRVEIHSAFPNLLSEQCVYHSRLDELWVSGITYMYIVGSGDRLLSKLFGSGLRRGWI